MKFCCLVQFLLWVTNGCGKNLGNFEIVLSNEFFEKHNQIMLPIT